MRQGTLEPKWPVRHDIVGAAQRGEVRSIVTCVILVTQTKIVLGMTGDCKKQHLWAMACLSPNDFRRNQRFSTKTAKIMSLHSTK